MASSPNSTTPDIDWLQEYYPEYEDQLLHRETLDPKDANTCSAHDVLPDKIADELGVDLFSHQASALSELNAGNNVTVATSTSSGKTWVYTLFFSLLKYYNSDARALFLYPTKALSKDQENAINELLKETGVDATAETYDGDTKSKRKPQIRNNRDIIITNFSGLNYYLRDHTKWRKFYQNVDLIVTDESHTYTGVQGMHVAWVLRRLKRVLSHYNSDPQYICSTATIGNPKEHSEALIGEEFNVIDSDGSPRGKRDIGIWQPTQTDTPDQVEDIDRRSSNGEVASLTTHLGKNNIQTLSFLRSRQGCEVAAKRAKQAAERHPKDKPVSATPYHAGLSKRRRTKIENGLKDGRVDGVFSTNALELGIDIGEVDATVLGGYPGTRQSFWQQIGRAGRGASDSLSVFVPKDAAMDQYIVDHPDYLLEDDVEDAVVSLSNNSVYAKHILCASDELTIGTDDIGLLGDKERLEKVVELWNAAGKMAGSLDSGAQYTGLPRPQQNISMYSTTDVQFDVRCVGNDSIEIEPIQKERAYRDFHPGALFMHDGVQYEVVDLHEDRQTPFIEVREQQTNERTITLNDKTVRNIESKRSVDLGGGYSIHAGVGTVDINYTEYKRLPIYEYDADTATPPQPINLPPISLQTQLMWVEMPNEMQEIVVDDMDIDQLLAPSGDVGGEFGLMTPKEWTFAGGLHGAEHGMIKMSPLELRIDNSDMGGLSTPRHAETGCPTWFIHDAVEGGVGFAHSVYDNFVAVAKKTLQRVSDCDCDDPSGCPSCLMSSQCGNDNEPLHKMSTAIILNKVLEKLEETNTEA